MEDTQEDKRFSKLKIFIISTMIICFWLAVGTGILLFAGILTLPSTTVTTQVLQGISSLPLKPNSSGIQSAQIMYVINSTIVKNAPTDSDNNLVTLSDITEQNIPINKNTYVSETATTPNSLPTIKRVFQLQPGEKISIILYYDLKKNKWSPPENPAINIKQSSTKSSPNIPTTVKP